MLWLGTLALLVFAEACTAVGDESADAAASVERSIAFSFLPEVLASADEVYACFAMDASALGGATLRGVSWTAPSGGMELHHAKLYATSELRPTDAAFDCEPMPDDAITLHVWARGGSQLALPMDTGLQLPVEVRTLVIEAHALRVGTEPPLAGQVSIALAAERPDKLAAWMRLRAPVPALRPRTRESSTSRCRFASPFHTLLAWPHMHRMGATFHAARLRADEETTLIDVDPWDFDEQRTYPVDVDLLPDDVVTVTCSWQNSTPQYVLPGALTQNEMCSLGLVGWPQEGAACASEPLGD